MKYLFVAVIVTVSLLPPVAHAISEKTVQAVSVDLDGDGIKDTASEITTGAKMNILRVALSKSKKVFFYRNILANPNVFDKESSWCNRVQPSVLKARKAEYTSQLEIRMQRGTDGGCETGYGYEVDTLVVSVTEKGDLKIASLQKYGIAHAHHDCHNEKRALYSFSENAVTVYQNQGYNSEHSRSQTVAIPEKYPEVCELSLKEYNHTKEVPQCAKSVSVNLWKSLWPKGELENPDYACGLEDFNP